MSQPDLRLTPIKNGIDYSHQEGCLFQVRAPVANIRKTPEPEGRLETQAMMGEVMRLFEFDQTIGWGWGQCLSDGYVGHVALNELSMEVVAPTHKVRVLRTLVFSLPDLKTAPIAAPSLNAQVRIVAENGKYGALATGGHIHMSHLAKLDVFADEFVAVAELYRGAPYGWGGKDSFALDCSGLVQSAMHAAGFNPPRDADMQENSDICGERIEIQPNLTGLERGDLIFWPGHVGIMLNETNMLHANAHHMMCASEPLSEAAQRIEQQSGHPIRTIRRPPALFQP